MITARRGGRASNDRNVSSQQTSPPPRSEVDCHQELRGVITISGVPPVVTLSSGLTSGL